MRPGEFSQPLVRLNQLTGKLEMTGADNQAWSIDTLALGGDIRSKFIRLQDWVLQLLDEKPAKK